MFLAEKMLGKLVKQSATYGISTILGRLLSYLLTPYYTRLFAPAEYGIITDLYALIPFALVVLTLGMESGYFRFAARAESEGVGAEDVKRRKDRLFATTWGITILLSMLFALAVIFNEGAVSGVMGEAYVVQPFLVSLVAGIVFFDVAAAVPFARFRECGETHKYVWLKLLNILLQVGFAVGFGVAGLFSTDLGVGWVLVANLLASVITLVIVGVVSKPYVLPRIDWSLLRLIAIYSFPLLLSGVAATATDFIDRQLIKYIAPVGAMAQLGLYGAVTKIAVVMTLFTQMYRLAAEPFFLANFKKEEFLESNAAAMKYYIVATMAIFLGISLASDLFMYIVGSDFREGESILPVILMSNLLMGVWLNLSFWYKREEQTKYALQITFVGLVVSVVMNFVLIPEYGYEGAAWARLISQVAMVLNSYYLMRRHFPIPYEVKRIVEYVILAVLLYGGGEVLLELDLVLIARLLICSLFVSAFVAYAVWREGVDWRGLVRRIAKRR